MADKTLSTTTTSSKKDTDPANKHLPAEVAALYEVVNWQGGHRQHFGRYGIVDLKNMTITRADRLVNTKFSKLRRK